MRLRVGEEASGWAYAERVAMVGEEHPDHPVDNSVLVAGDESARS